MAILNAQCDFRVVATCCDSASCIQAVRKLVPELVLVDVKLDGFGVLAAIRETHVSTRVVFVSESRDRCEVARAIAAGAHGIIARQESPDSFLRDLRKVTFGGRLLPPATGKADPLDHRQNHASVLTDREREIMHLVCAGLSNKEIGRHLNLSDGTIKVHLHHIYEKLAIRNRTALAALAIDSDEEAVKEATSSGRG
jgi:two-component system, NarL family, nitrate/nitrite response regulator NarL